jgi:3-oxoadipate enol-lactonase/4-carboxymuconolactone decarboxylase
MAREETNEPASPRSIEDGAEDFLRANRAPVEIEADWNDWINRGGSEVWARPDLSRAQRSIATISILSVTHQEGPLRVHVEAGLANGLSRKQIGEVIMHSAVYAGVPQALRSMQIAFEVFEQLDAAGAEKVVGTGD